MINIFIALMFLTSFASADVVIENHAKREVVTTAQMNKVLKDVVEFTGLDDAKVSLVIYPTHKETCATFRKLGNKGRCPDAFCIGQIVWTDAQEIRYYVLTHEFTHALEHAYIGHGKQLPEKLGQALANWVANNI